MRALAGETGAVKKERVQNAKPTPPSSRTPLAKIKKTRKKEEENRKRTFHGCAAIRTEITLGVR